MAGMKFGSVRHKIKGIDLVRNATLEGQFEGKKGDFKRRGIPDHEVLAFHGTPVHNVESILKKNLDPALHKRQGHGAGAGFFLPPPLSDCVAHYHYKFKYLMFSPHSLLLSGSYFSEYPDYGPGLILFRTLPGREYCGGSMDWPGHNSKKVNPEHTQGYGDMLIIKSPNQFVPYFVYHLER